MKKLPIIAIGILFIVLMVVYFRHVIWSPLDALLTNHLATDLYGHFVHAWERLGLLKDGFIPIGDYWVQRGGGFPAALNDQITIPQEFLLMLVYAATNSFVVALKFVDILFYSATLITAYWLGTVLFKRRDASVILATAYTFSVYGANQLEHLELLNIQPLILLTLVFLEKTLQSGKPQYVILTSLGLLSVGLSNLYPLYFLLVFIGFRVIFQLLTTQRWLETLRNVSKVGALFLLATTPFLLPKLLNMPPEQLIDAARQGLTVYSQPPSLYFLRNTPYESYITETYFMYLGLAVLLLALVPMILKRDKNSLHPLYIFYLLTTVFFMTYAVGQYGSVNLALFFQKYVPLASFIQVPGRALVIGYLSLSVCAAIGFITLTDKWPKIRRAPSLLLIVAIIFADLTIGFEPITMTPPPRQESVYQFIREQPGNFRIVEIPSVHGQQAITNIYTERDTLNSVLWAFGHFEPLYTFAGVYHNYTDLSVTAQEAALYGVKYVAVNTDPQYFVTFGKALEVIGGPSLAQTWGVEDMLSRSDDYGLVYSEKYTNVYENLKYRGMVFSYEADLLTWSRYSPNTLTIDYDSAMSTTITISQSYSNGWVAVLDGKEKLPIRNLDSIQQIEVPSGSHSLVLHYQNYERWVITLAAFYSVLGIAIWWLLRRSKAAKVIKNV